MRIRTFRVFADLPAVEIDLVLDTMREVEVDTGTNVVTVDDYGTATYFIEEGTADVLAEDGTPTETLGKGDAFGEIGRACRSSSARCAGSAPSAPSGSRLSPLRSPWVLGRIRRATRAGRRRSAA
jgi:CRP-like cAMP-binding protein